MGLFGDTPYDITWTPDIVFPRFVRAHILVRVHVAVLAGAILPNYLNILGGTAVMLCLPRVLCTESALRSGLVGWTMSGSGMSCIMCESVRYIDRSDFNTVLNIQDPLFP